jgi:hypothetical protein
VPGVEVNHRRRLGGRRNHADMRKAGIALHLGSFARGFPMSDDEVPKSDRRRLPDRRESELVSFEALGLKFTASISRYPSDEIGELFIDPAKLGSTINTLVHDTAIAFSFAVRPGPVHRGRRRELSRANKAGLDQLVWSAIDTSSLVQVSGTGMAKRQFNRSPGGN